MNIQVLFFARLREAMGGISERSIALEVENPTVQSVLDVLTQENSDWGALLTASDVKIAVNQKFASLDTVLQDGGEVAFLPPITGG